ncbi:MAG: hypothetical protein ABSB12_01440 [Candidatus Saccharimonadales bacterium]|jgi:hypothetical protein
MDTPFFDSLIDDFGIWQHSDGNEIYLNEGFALDDAARGLVVCLALHKFDQAEVLFKYIRSSWHLNGFYGFATKEKGFVVYPASEDATGQAMWAAGYAYSLGFHKAEANQLARSLKPVINKFSHIRGRAYALLGTVYLDLDLALTLASKLVNLFDGLEDDWFWPEPEMTYGNGIMAYALLRYAIIAKDPGTAKTGLQILKFINSMCSRNRLLSPIGNQGWLTKNQLIVPTYSQQPIDAAYMVWAWLAAYQYFNKPSYYQSAKQWMDWFEGKNIKSKKMYEPKSLKCFDGINQDGINYHSGAESNICWLLSRHLLANQSTI